MGRNNIHGAEMEILAKKITRRYPKLKEKHKNFHKLHNFKKKN